MSQPTPPAARAGASADEEMEARAHDAFMRTLDPVIAAAAEWHTRREDGLGPAEEAQFQHWLAADPAHARAYGRLDQGLGALRRLPGGQADQLGAPTQPGTPAHAAPHRRERPAHPPARRAWRISPTAIALGCVLLAATGLGWHAWHQPTFTHQYATQRGQRVNATLPDGSELALDVATRASATLYRDRREVQLSQGQALFTVAPDPGKPFRVLAGPARITVTGTRFSVRYAASGGQAGAVEVAVEEGTVAVDGAASPSSAPGAAVRLTAGQAVQVSAAGTVGEIAAVPVAGVALWRKGLVRFSDTPLSEVIAELERYGPTGLVVEDPQVAGLRLGGSFETARPGALAQVLPQILPVRLRPRGDGMQEVVSAR